MGLAQKQNLTRKRNYSRGNIDALCRLGMDDTRIRLGGADNKNVEFGLEFDEQAAVGNLQRKEPKTHFEFVVEGCVS